MIPSSSSISVTCTNYPDIEEPLDDLTSEHSQTYHQSFLPTGRVSSGKATSILSKSHRLRALPRRRQSFSTQLQALEHTGYSSHSFGQTRPSPLTSFPKYSPYSQLPCASISIICACERPRFCARPTFGLVFSPLPHPKTSSRRGRAGAARLRDRAGTPSRVTPSFLGGFRSQKPRCRYAGAGVGQSLAFIDCPGEGKIGFSLQNCLMDLDSIRGLRDRLGPGGV